jgi:molybdopterin/thiamine biosynthesis adenylyltransferase
MNFTEEQIHRYSRQMILPGLGGKGQRKLAAARVLVMGVGGLGSPAALYLAAAGVGTIGLADSDCVELQNLQRQILYRTEDIGSPKVESGRRTIASLNPEVQVRAYKERVTSTNIREVIRDYDLVLDGSDNFPTRFLVNDACYFERKTLISGAILRFDGQLSTFKAHDRGPCYRCLLPEPPPPGLVPSCQEAGILGPVAAVIGVLQANEALKEILGIGKSMVGRFLFFNALSLSFHEIQLVRNPDCPLCGDSPSIRELKDYHQICSSSNPPFRAPQNLKMNRFLY